MSELLPHTLMPDEDCERKLYSCFYGMGIVIPSSILEASAKAAQLHEDVKDKDGKPKPPRRPNAKVHGRVALGSVLG